METILKLALILSSITSGNGPAQPATAIESMQIKPPFKVLTLSCLTGPIFTNVTNNTKTTVPQIATITVHGKEAVCSFAAQGPLAPGKSIILPGCPEPVRTCVASAKWPTDQ